MFVYGFTRSGLVLGGFRLLRSTVWGLSGSCAKRLVTLPKLSEPRAPRLPAASVAAFNAAGSGASDSRARSPSCTFQWRWRIELYDPKPWAQAVTSLSWRVSWRGVCPGGFPRPYVVLLYEEPPVLAGCPGGCPGWRLAGVSWPVS